MVFGIVVGIVVGYLFKPQLDVLVKKILKTAKKNMNTEEE